MFLSLKLHQEILLFPVFKKCQAFLSKRLLLSTVCDETGNIATPSIFRLRLGDLLAPEKRYHPVRRIFLRLSIPLSTPSTPFAAHTEGCENIYFLQYEISLLRPFQEQRRCRAPYRHQPRLNASLRLPREGRAKNMLDAHL